MWREFKEFALSGNMLDLAIGLIIGSAFGKIVTSLVTDILLPPLGLLMGKVDFSNLYLVLSGNVPPGSTLEQAKAINAVTINYGLFINTVIDFLIVAFAIFLLVRQVNRLRRQPQAVPASPTTKECPYCFTSIPIKAVRCPNCTSQLST